MRVQFTCDGVKSVHSRGDKGTLLSYKSCVLRIQVNREIGENKK